MKERQEGGQEPGQFLPAGHCPCHPYLASEVTLHSLLTPLSCEAGPPRASSPFRICCMTCFHVGTALFTEAASSGSFTLHSGRPFTLP